jgi:hypothetical protein
MRFIWLAYMGEFQPENLTEEERNAMFDKCFEYDDWMRANGHFPTGEALEEPECAMTFYWKNGKVVTTDGPYIETKDQLGGIGILEARDINHAHQLIAQHPALTYGVVFDLRPTTDMSRLEAASKLRRQQKMTA